MDGEDVAEILEQILGIEDRPTAIQAVNNINAIAIIEETKKKVSKLLEGELIIRQPSAVCAFQQKP